MLQPIGEAVLGKFPPDAVAGASHPVPVRAAALDHEAFYDTVEDKAVIVALAGKADEIIYGVRCNFRIQLRFYGVAVFHLKCYNWVLGHCVYLFPDFLILQHFCLFLLIPARFSMGQGMHAQGPGGQMFFPNMLLVLLYPEEGIS